MKQEINISDTKSFIGLLVANQRRIWAFILSLVPNLNDAEDILQETLVEMWAKFDRYQPGTDFAAWGVTIAKYKVLTYRKKHRPQCVFSEEALQLLENDCRRVLDTMDTHLDVLSQCIQKLSSKDKRLLSLRYEMDMTYQKMADCVGSTPQGIHRVLSFIHGRLAQCIRLTLRLEEAS